MVHEIEAETKNWLGSLRAWAHKYRASRPALRSRNGEPRIGLALGGGFARGIAHVGVLRVFERHNIPIHCIGGVSAGAMVAGAFASGSTADDIGRIGSAMRMSDVAKWSISKMGFSSSTPMDAFLSRLLKTYRFEDMKIPFVVVATCLTTGEPVYFRDSGDVKIPIRASCSYPGMFQPIYHEGKILVDGAMSIDIPSGMLRTMGANRVISVHLPMQGPKLPPSNMFQVVNRCFQIMQVHMEREWRRHSDIVIQPEVCSMEWDSFGSAQKLIEAGEEAAMAALPKIQAWLHRPARTKGLPQTAARGLETA